MITVRWERYPLVDRHPEAHRRLQLVAAELLCRNAAGSTAANPLHWPSRIDGDWNPQFGPKTKLLLLDALIRMTLARPVHEDALRSVAVRLYGVWKADPDKRVRGCVGRLIASVVPSLQRLGYTDFMRGNRRVMLTDLKRAAASGTHNPDGHLDNLVNKRCAELITWATTPCQPDTTDDRHLVAVAS